MSYLYKKPTKRSSYGKASIEEVKEVVNPERESVRVPTLWEEKVDVPTPLDSHITEISYEEYLKNLELMCKADRTFMKRVKEFCDDNKEEAFNVVKPVSDKESSSEYEERSE
jgi:phage host-nuclease inhibitor protein Gam